jgi:NADPH-dependent 2,4-dienoyl-CoA reductase/sulfur reductase-like enzyme
MRIVIIGNGIAGVTAARFIRKRSDHEILLISDESEEFFSRTALMYVYMGHMREMDIRPYEPWFWEKNRINRLRNRVHSIDYQSKSLATAEQQKINYDVLIIATGSVSNRFGWPGQDLDGVGGLYHLQDLEKMEHYSKGLKRAVIVGGGLIGIEMAEMFHSRHIPVTFLVRERSFWDAVLPLEESAMVTRHIREHGVDLQLGVSLQEIQDDGTGRCGTVRTSDGENIPCGFVGLTAGVSPNIGFLKNSGIDINRGILVDKYLKTNMPDVYAIGDCAELREPDPGRRSIEAVWYCGRMMGETVAHTITENPVAYQPGIWFNSAKFFDIEYQVYGDIRTSLPEEQATVYWEHPAGKKSIRINYHRESGAVSGFNLMGIRYRHEVCEKWIRTQTSVETVLSHLGLANFDPEFYPEHEPAMIAQYHKMTGKALASQSKRGLSKVLAFLK